MTVTAAISHLLQFFAPEERSIPDNASYPGRNASALLALNAALQEYYGVGGSWRRRETRGKLLHEPTTVTVAVTLNSTTISITDAPSWVPGCTILISGASIDNQLLNATNLLYPHDGPTGTVSAVIFHDSVTLDDDVQSLLTPVRIVDGQPLHPVNSPEQLTIGRARERDYGHHNHIPTYPANVRKSQSAGTPLFYFVDNFQNASSANPAFRLQISPAPASAMMLSYRVRLSPPTFSDPAATTNLPVPFDAAESIILPIAAQRLTASPFFRQGPHTAEIARQAGIARTQLFGLTAQAKSGIRLRPGI